VNVALLTDFGHRDPYVGMMKGVILRGAPGAAIVDLCHEVPPQDVGAAAFFLASSVRYFSHDTLFVCVVDPGVGSSRAILWAKSRRHQFLVPDNGLLDRLDSEDRPVEIRRVTNKRLFLPEVSRTFHGRDVFAPVAGALLSGFAPDRLGPKARPPRRLPKGSARGVIHVDHFGNCVTTLRAADVKRGAAVWIAGRRIGALKKTYASVRPGTPLALVGSYGLVELSVRDGDFAAEFKVQPGETVHVR
jgi:S-adenosylmethionine hydrolase